MNVKKNILIAGVEGKPMAVDVFLPEENVLSPVVIYAHGFNGFKDWGNFDLIAKQFATAGLAFVKFNFSHNGTTPQHPEDFVDLEAYGNNNYTKELDDLSLIINWVSGAEFTYADKVDLQKVFLLGHSMGGGLVLLKAAEDARVKKVATWAAISECKTPWTNWPAERLKSWRASGVEYSINSRTKQKLPLYFQLYENYLQNQERLDIKRGIGKLQIPVLLCHGTNDEAVPVEKARDLERWQPAAELFVVDSDHVFGRRHPWMEDALPEAMQHVVDKTIQFFKK